MAVEDHDDFERWSLAFDAYKRADEVYNEASRLGIRKDWIEHARMKREMARQTYEQVSAEIRDA